LRPAIGVSFERSAQRDDLDIIGRVRLRGIGISRVEPLDHPAGELDIRTGHSGRQYPDAEIDALETELGPAFGPLVTFAAETGLRTNEWVALERRDLDRSGPAVLVQRRYADGALTPYPKTVGSRRRVPLSARALEALDRLPPRLDTPLVFPAARGGYIGLDGRRTRHWYPALEAAGLRQRGPYQLRHTFATEALAAGISIFELARVMGTSVKMIDRTYGHLARDSEQAIRDRLNSRARPRIFFTRS
jgi:integrase